MGRGGTCSPPVVLAAIVFLVLMPGTSDAADTDEIARDQAEFIRANGDRPVVGIRFEGLHRTRQVVVDQWITCAVGHPLSTCDWSLIRHRLFRLAVFSTVDVAFNAKDEGAEVVVTFDEKWTLYPVPVLWYSPGTQMAGAVLVEANLLGFNKGLAIGGAYTNLGWYTLAGYNDPNIAYTSLWGSLHGFLGDTLVENQTPDGTVEQSFDMTRFDLEYSIGWTFWDRLSPVYTGAYRIAHVETVHVPGTSTPTSATVAVQGFNLIYSYRQYRELYDDGLRFSTEVQHAFPLEVGAQGYNDAIFDVKWAGAAPLHGFFDVRAHAFVGSMPVVFEERLGGLDGSRTLPGVGLVAADRYASLSFAYQIPFLTLPLGTATAVPFGEIGRYARNDEAAVTYGGPGLGFRIFLKQVAIPAVGVDAGYEVGSKAVNFSVSVGYRPLR